MVYKGISPSLRKQGKIGVPSKTAGRQPASEKNFQGILETVMTQAAISKIIFPILPITQVMPHSMLFVTLIAVGIPKMHGFSLETGDGSYSHPILQNIFFQQSV